MNITDSNRTANPVLAEAFRSSEKRVETQQTFALAADQRSLVLCGAAVAACAFVADMHAWAESVLLQISSGAFIASALFAISSAAPHGMHSVGSSFSSMMAVIEEQRHIDEVLIALSANHDENFKDNEKIRVRMARIYGAAIKFFFVGSGSLFFALLSLSQLPLLENKGAM